MKVLTGKYICLGVLLAATAFPALGTNLFTNGSFETGDFTGWTRDGNNNWLIDNGLPQSGLYEAVTFCGGAGCISTPLAFMYQDLITSIGTTYALSFWYMNEHPGPPPPPSAANELQVLVGGVVTVDLINQPFDTTYHQISVAFTATALTTRIEFRGRSDADFLLLDNVCSDVNDVTGVCGVASGVPEPSSLVITGTGALV